MVLKVGVNLHRLQSQLGRQSQLRLYIRAIRMDAANAENLLLAAVAPCGKLIDLPHGGRVGIAGQVDAKVNARLCHGGRQGFLRGLTEDTGIGPGLQFFQHGFGNIIRKNMGMGIDNHGFISSVSVLSRELYPFSPEYAMGSPPYIVNLFLLF